MTDGGQQRDGGRTVADWLRNRSENVQLAFLILLLVTLPVLVPLLEFVARLRGWDNDDIESGRSTADE